MSEVWEWVNNNEHEPLSISYKTISANVAMYGGVNYQGMKSKAYSVCDGYACNREMQRKLNAVRINAEASLLALDDLIMEIVKREG